MHRRTIIFCMGLLLGWCLCAAQHTYTPYPIIFVHGLASSDIPWYRSFAAISRVYGDHVPSLGNDAGTVVHAMLNRYRSTTNIFGQDGIEGTDDDDVYVSNDPLMPGAIYTVNFHTSWNEEPSRPMIIPYENHWTFASESQSNQASVVKQGYALKRCIEKVLAVNSADKVILVGHSMGGIAIREYLQRRIGQKPLWWVDPDAIDGHHVAKVVTIGTPHGGSDAASWVPKALLSSIASELVAIFGVRAPDVSCEAMRDLRTTYNTGVARRGVYLFGGQEQGLNTNWLFGGWYNADVDCNGREDDTITGINEELDGRMPLPDDIAYTWIISTIPPLGSDGLVDTAHQVLVKNEHVYPLGRTDTLHAHHAHWNGMFDAYTIMRGLDEPDSWSSAYVIRTGRHYRGGITLRSSGRTTDTDVYRLLLDSADMVGGLRLTVREPQSHQHALQIRLLSSTGDTLLGTNVGMQQPVVVNMDASLMARAGTSMYVVITGTAQPDRWEYPYEFAVMRHARPRHAPRVRVYADTTIAHVDTLAVALSIVHDDYERITWDVISTDTSVISRENVTIIGNGSRRILRVVPTPYSDGKTELRVTLRDGVYETIVVYRIHVVSPRVHMIPSSHADASVVIRPLADNDDIVVLTSTDPSILVGVVEILDIAGRSVYHSHSTSPSSLMSGVRINLENALPGTYMLRIQTSQGAILKPLLVGL